MDAFRREISQLRLRFAGTPPPLPQVPGLLQAFRTENELRVVCVHYNEAVEKSLRALGPLEIETLPISLEDAFISYLGERGEKTFILSETEAP